MRKTVAQVVVDALVEIGVKYVFGVPSGAWIDYLEAIRKTEGIEFILTSHEGGAAFMACVTGQLTGVPGVCFGTFGPGATNLATGVGCAYLDRSPMIALTDEMPDEKIRRKVQMNIDHQALFAPITKQTFRLDPIKAHEQIIKAARVAISDRPGPVHVGLPLGIASMKTDASDKSVVTIPELLTPSAQQLDKMEQMFKEAKKPIMVIGLGAIRNNLDGLYLAVAEKFKLPIVLTPMAKGMISENHPNYSGVLFHALSDHVAVTYRQADLVISVGYDPVEVNYEDWMPQVPLISIDTQKVDIDRHEYSVVCEVLGNMRSALDRLLFIKAPLKAWDLNALARQRTAMFSKMTPSSGTFGPCVALDILRDVLPGDGIMACDVGAHTHLIGQKWPTPAVGKQLMTNGWSAMGYAIPAAIAAKMARPELPVCAVIGDGGFLMTAGELAVAVRESLNIVFVLFTDNDLSLIRIKQEKKHNPEYATTIRQSGTIGSKQIFNVPVLQADNSEVFRSALEQAFQLPGPSIVEAILDGSEYDELVLRNQK